MILLNLDENNRILSIGEVYVKPNPEAIIVESTPQDDFNDYRFVNGTYIYDPLPPIPPPPYAPTSEERIAALEDALAASLLGGHTNV